MYVVYDMFIRGKKGRRAPFIIPALTQFQFCLVCLKNSNLVVCNKLPMRASLVLFFDVAKD